MARFGRNAVGIVTIIITILCIFHGIYGLKGEINMRDMYLALVIAGRRTCNPENKAVKQVPAKYREAVLEDLAAIDLDADGNPLE